MNPSKKIIKFAVFTFIFIILLLGLTAVFLPTIVSSQWGQRQVLSFINTQIPGKISARDLNLSWVNDQTIEDLVLKDPAGNNVITIEKLSIRSPLWQFISKNVSLGASDIQGLNATILLDSNGHTNLQKALSFDLPATESPVHSTPLPLTFSNVHAQFSKLTHGNPFTIHLTGETKQGDVIGHLDVDILLPPLTHSQWADLSKNSSSLLSGNEKAHLKAKITNFPVDILDDIIALNKPELRGIFHELLGAQLNLSVDDDLSQDGQTFTLALSSPNVTGDLKGRVIDRQIQLSQPGQLTLNATQELFDRLKNHAPALSDVKIDNLSPFTLSLSKLNFPLDGNDQASLDFTLANEAVSFTQLSSKEQTHLRDINLSVNTETLSKIASRLTISVESPKMPSIVGKEGHIIVDTSLGLHNNDILKIHQFKTELKGNQGIAITLNVDPTQINTKAIDFSTLNIRGNASVNQLLLQEGLSIHDLLIPWEFNPSLNKIKLNIDGTVVNAAEQISSPLKGLFLLENFMHAGTFKWDKMRVNSDVNLKQVPLAFLNAFVSTIDLGILIGDAVDLNLTGAFDLNNDLPGSMILAINSSNLQATGHFIIEEGSLRISEAQPLNMTWRMTPKGWSYLRSTFMDMPSGQDNLQLNEETDVIVKITSLYIPIKQTSLIIDNGLKANLLVRKINITNRKSNEKLQINNLKLDLESPRQTDLILYNLIADPFPSSGKSETKIAVKGEVKDLFQPSGKFNKSGLSCRMNVDCKEVSIQKVGALLAIDDSTQARLKALIGDTLNAVSEINVQKMTGTITAQVYGELGQAKLDGRVKDGVLTLNKALEFQVKVTPQLGQTILNDFVPILSSAVNSSEPIKITIDPKGFSFPLSNFTIQETQVPYITMVLGKINFLNKGELKSILSILKTDNRDQLSIWFTPLYVGLQDGVIYCKRMDMLIADEYPAAIWGNVDLTNDKVNMVVGLGGPALRRAFGIKGLDKNYLIQLSLTGKTGKVRIEQAKATAHIASLIAQTQEHPAGKILGVVFEMAANGFSDPTPPEPTTKPFPWAEMTQEENAEQPSVIPVEQKKKSSKKKLGQDDVIKELEKGASKLLDFLK